MTESFSMDLFSQAAQDLKTLLQRERLLLADKDYDALAVVWSEKERALKRYEDQSLLFRTLDHPIEINPELFQTINQDILDEAQMNEMPLHHLKNLSAMILTVMTDMGNDQVGVSSYGPQGALHDPGPIQKITPLRANHYV